MILKSQKQIDQLIYSRKQDDKEFYFDNTNETLTAGIEHRLRSATGDRNVCREFVSFMAKTERCNAYESILATRQTV